ncbi:uncharacterized protein LOC141735045 [Larus michahellis]|uniref:uncharacterized protein LOC141735045 n=1 Tax=Larus michahellis TaxID=119627 RepID=UPI003D9AF5B5
MGREKLKAANCDLQISNAQTEEETDESKTWLKGKTEADGEKGERPPEGDKSAFLSNPAKKTELNQETGKTIVSGENVPPAKEPAEKPETSSSKVEQENAKGEVRRKVTAADGSSSTLVNDTSSSSTGGSAVRKTEEEPDTKASVVEAMEEHSSDIPAPAEDVVKLKSEARGSQSLSSRRVSRSRGQSPSESQTRSHRGSASSAANQGSKKKKKKKEKQQHKKHKKHIGNNMELGKRQNHKHKKKKMKKSKEKEDQKVQSLTTQNDR